MAPPRGSASYKKKPGLIAMAADSQSVTWTAVGASAPDLTLAVSTITNLQQTPATSPKAMLKIFEQVPGSSDTTAHTFTFASDDGGRAEAGAIRDALSKAIQALKAGPPPSNAPSPAANGSDGVSAAMAIAAALSSAQEGSQYDDEQLLKDGALQAALLKKDKRLADTFQQAMKSRPSSIAITAFNKQFWSSRVRLLRAFAVERAQKKGEHHVLSSLKPYNDKGESKISIDQEQITLILKQFPIVQKAQAEYMSKNPVKAPRDATPEDISRVRNSQQAKFWTEFFQSRLLKVLKGQKIDRDDPKHPIIDKFIDAQNDDAEREKRLLAMHVPHMIDLEGNRVDNSQRQGNAPDFDNRPNEHDKVPILRTVNAMSERLLKNVAPSDVDPSAPIGVDEATYNEMALRDLAAEAEAQHKLLNIRDKAKFFATGKGADDLSITKIYDKQDPRAVLRTVASDLKSLGAGGLVQAIGVNDSDSDEDMEDDDQPKDTHVGSRTSRKQATRQIFDLVRERRAQIDDELSGLTEEEVALEFGLSIDLYKEILLANAASVVFLSHFWSAYHSGDHSRAGELQGVVEALEMYLQTYEGVAAVAEKERQVIINEHKARLRAHYERTGQKRTFDPRTIKGGKPVVDQLFSSLVKPVKHALATHAAALEIAKKEEAK